MGRRELIIDELIEALDTDGSVETVLRRHEESRSPLYQALVFVIRTAEDRLRKAVRDAASARKQTKTLRQQEEALNARIQELEEQVTARERLNVQLEDTVKTKQTLLDEMDSLERSGFHADRLKQLG